MNPIYRVAAVVQSFFANLTVLFALGLPNTGAPFIVMAFFTVMTFPVVMFVLWVERQLGL